MSSLSARKVKVTPEPRIEPKSLARYGAGRTLVPLKHYLARDPVTGKSIGKLPNRLDWTTKTFVAASVIHNCVADNANVGWRLGREDLVLDIDARNGGLKSFKRFCKDTGLDPSKFVKVNSGRGDGGFHLYMTKPAEMPTRETLKKYPGVEFKTFGRQVVCAGSLHHATGDHYTFDAGHPRIEDGVRPAPKGILRLIEYAPSAGDYASDGVMTAEGAARLLDGLDPAKVVPDNAAFEKFAPAAKKACADEDAESAILEWLALDDGQDADSASARWNSYDNDRAGGVGVGTFIYMLRQHGVGMDTIYSVFPPPQVAAEDDFPDDGAADDDSWMGGEDDEWLEGQKAEDDDDGVAPEGWSPSKKNPYKAAQEFVARQHPTLVHWKGDWLEWNGSHYVVIEDATIKAELYPFCRTGFTPNKTAIAHTEDALKAVAHKPEGRFDPPCWLDGNATLGSDGKPMNPKDILAFKDSLLHLPTMTQMAATPNFFTLNALTYSFDPNAPKPKHWRKFMLEVFAESRKGIGVLQEIFGYMLLPDTRYQKSFLWISPPRGGKGTAARVLQRMVGAHNVVSPSMGGLAKDPILASMVGKQVALVSDMQINRNTNISDVVGNLLRITGNDPVTFDRKYKDAWTGQLLVRFLILTNLPPKFPDLSGAITNRFIILQTFRSWLGTEDTGLEGRLMDELPGILLWAIAGWKRLHARGHFIQPPDGARALRQMAEQSAPVKGFVRECCILDPDAITPKAGLYAAWRRWEDRTPEDEGHALHDSDRDDGTFGKALLAGFGDKVRETRPRDGDGGRVQSWSGVRLRDWLEDGAYEDPL